MNTRLADRIGFAAWGALALLQIVWHGWLLPPRTAPLTVVLAIALLPLAIPLLYWRAPRRALLVAGMVGLFYFCHGVAQAWSAPHQRVLACIEILLVLVLVFAQARRPKRRRPRAARQPSASAQEWRTSTASRSPNRAPSTDHAAQPPRGAPNDPNGETP